MDSIIVNGKEVFTSDDNRLYILHESTHRGKPYTYKYYGELRNCASCGKLFFVRTAKLKEGNGRFCSLSCINTGEFHHSYKGNASLNTSIRRCVIFRQLKLAVFQRDDFTCQYCGERGGKLNAHHIIRFGKIIEDNNITTLEEAYDCELLWDITNQITLCEKCHRELHKNKGYTY
jgi:5-methylcytosine-specific restriction endonuclease McrA